VLRLPHYVGVSLIPQGTGAFQRSSKVGMELAIVKEYMAGRLEKGDCDKWVSLNSY